jgi:large subunit ribosomal protein L4e
MSLARPVVSIYNTEDPSKASGKSMKLAAVFSAPLRPDLVRTVFTDISKNRRQAYGVSDLAGHQHSAVSWGTGRAVSRVPRIAGGGTSKSGSGAFGNMCRGGHMFAPNKTWRRWHRSPNQTQKRHAMASSIAASALPALVMARGHRISAVPELPLIVSDDMQNVKRSKSAVSILEKLGLADDLNRVKETRQIRAGAGKARNRRYATRKGPLVVFAEDNGLVAALRNIPGVETCHVEKLNLLQTAPGGTFGRIIVWTESAAQKLSALFGDYNTGASLKSGYRLLRPQMSNADLAAIINSDEIQAAIRPAKMAPKKTGARKCGVNNKKVMEKLNPAHASKRRFLKKLSTKGSKLQAITKKAQAKKAVLAKKHSNGKKFIKSLLNSYKSAPAPAEE